MADSELKGQEMEEITPHTQSVWEETTHSNNTPLCCFNNAHTRAYGCSSDMDDASKIVHMLAIVEMKGETHSNHIIQL